MEQTDQQFSGADHDHMELALRLARRAARQGEVPIGAVLIDQPGRVVAAEFNRSVCLSDPTAHAEILAMRRAAAALGNYRLTGHTLYVSLEPCAMCAGAMVWARLARVVYAASDPKAGALGSALDLAALPSLNHHFVVQGGLMADQSVAILRDFFARRRR